MDLKNNLVYLKHIVLVHNMPIHAIKVLQYVETSVNAVLLVTSWTWTSSLVTLGADGSRSHDNLARVKRLMIAVMLLELVSGALGTSAQGVLFHQSKCHAGVVELARKRVPPIRVHDVGQSRLGLGLVIAFTVVSTFLSLWFTYDTTRRAGLGNIPMGLRRKSKLPKAIVRALELAVSVRVREEDLILSTTELCRRVLGGDIWESTSLSFCTSGCFGICCCHSWVYVFLLLNSWKSLTLAE